MGIGLCENLDEFNISTSLNKKYKLDPTVGHTILAKIDKPIDCVWILKVTKDYGDGKTRQHRLQFMPKEIKNEEGNVILIWWLAELLLKWMKSIKI